MVHDRGVRSTMVPGRRERNMKIGEVGKETGLSASNIRFYEKKGLLCPKRREESQYREYGPEDVRRLKEIMLFRKLGISVESIYLMYQGQAEYDGLLRRQEEELSEQMEMLKGALELCRLLKGKGPVSKLDVDGWLGYVHTEEKNGKQFARAEELLEDLAGFSRMDAFRGDPYVGSIFRKWWMPGALALCGFVQLLTVAITSVLSGGGVMGRAVIGFWLLYFAGLVLCFLQYRKKKRQKEKEESER